MISAIFEILALLGVSCLIGIFFTFRYWKAKYADLENQNAQLQTDLVKSKTDLDSMKQRSKTMESELSACQKEKKEATDELSSSKADLVSIKEENKTLGQKISLLENDLKNAKQPAKPSQPKGPDPTGMLKPKIEMLEEQLAEKERELEAVSKELADKKISYYKQIDGKRYKAITLKMADESVAGKGDGRISKADAMKIFDTISDGKAYTQVEKDTMHYLRENYNWTDEADALFRTKVRSWAAKHHDLDS